MPKMTYIPAGHYLTKKEAANILGLKISGLQHHINIGTLKTIIIPGLGHIISQETIENFKPNRVGRPKKNESK